MSAPGDIQRVSAKEELSYCDSKVCIPGNYISIVTNRGAMDPCYHK